ncbi:MAG TPA: T9SS type A sorting domain-containing protein, partial [Bacteroidota bacterium]|nr:T9SS type A sorting domain-containing protein [Bacteroidota bacterium]
GGIFLSTDDGSHWTAIDSGLVNIDIWTIVISGKNIYAGTDAGIVFSTDNGTSWAIVDSGLARSSVIAFTVSGTSIFAGTYGNGIFLSTNSGSSWSAVDSGLTDAFVGALTVSGSNLFAGTYKGGVWKRPIPEMITSVVETPRELPKQFSLAQNYPNPFNPGTTINFELPKESRVQLQLYNLLGQNVLNILNETRPAGVYEVLVNAGNLSSGVYFYRLEATSMVDLNKTFMQVRKMVLMK